MRSSKPLLPVLVLLVLAAGCGGGDGADASSTSEPPSPGDTATTSAPEPAGAADLVGTEWIVDGFSVGGIDFALVPDADPTIRFSPDGPELGGTTGCNSYFASIDYGPAGELSISQVGQTEMACFPDEVMDQEAQFTQALPAVRFYAVDGDRLTLVSEDGAVTITAVNRESVELPVGLADGEWIADTRIEREAASTLVPGTEVTVTFDPALGTIGGSTGCNVFGGSYVIDDDRIRMRDINGTERACEAEVMDQQQFFYEVLANADTFTIDHNRLTIMTKDGRGMSFTPDTAE